jgi:hypothetical protein
MKKTIIIFFISFIYCLTAMANNFISTSITPTTASVTVTGTHVPSETLALQQTATSVNQSPTSSANVSDNIPSSALNSQPSGIEPSTPARSRKMVSIPPTTSIDIVIHKKYIHSPKIQKLYKMLGAVGTPRVLHLVDNRDLGFVSRQNNIFVFQQRTFLGALYYLRNAVEFTDEAVQLGLIDMIKYPNGRYYNLTDITKGLLHIHISNTRPQCNTNLLVYYRNHWFYIADNDIVSKKTIALLGELFNLHAGDHSSQAPLVTIPVR